MKTVCLFLVLVVGTTSFIEVSADEKVNENEQVQRWVKEGKVLPLEDILSINKQRLKGRLLDLEVEQEDERVVYELEILRDQDVIYEIKVDATTGEWLEEEVEN